MARTIQVLHRALTSACNHGHRAIDAIDAIHNALTGNPWMPPPVA
jgi:hypothetical protein